MEQRYVGASGLRVSVLGLGTWLWGADIDAAEAADMLDAFVDAGGTTVEVAPGGHDAGAVLGSLLASLHRREDLVLVARSGSSAPGPGGPTAPGDHDVSRRALLQDLDDLLTHLGTDHLDLWLADGWSADVPLGETLSALQHAQRTGRCRYVGVAGYAGWQLARAATLAPDVVATAVEWSLTCRRPEQEVVPAAAELGVGVLAGSALGRGSLSGKYRDGVPSDSRAAAAHLSAMAPDVRASRSVVEALVTAGDGLGVPPAHVALGWLCARPELSAALVGPRTSAQLTGLLGGVSVELPEEIRAVLDEVSVPGR